MGKVFNETDRTRKHRQVGPRAYERHDAIAEALNGVSEDTDAWVMVGSGLRMQLKNVRQIHDLLADAHPESEGKNWQLRIQYDHVDAIHPSQVILVVLSMPFDIPAVTREYPADTDKSESEHTGQTQ